MTRPVVSAHDIRSARRRNEHRVEIPTNAILTPLARDEAARWGIELIEERGAPSTRRHAATCDPDDVERVAERVLGRMPSADPAVVREIARRVLEKGKE